MKIEQKVNLPAIQEINLNSTSTSKTEQSDRQKDVFEKRIAARNEELRFEHENAELEYAVKNVEAFSIPMTPMGTYLNLGKSDRAPINAENVSEQSKDANEEESKTKEAEKQTTSDQRILIEDLRLMHTKIKA